MIYQQELKQTNDFYENYRDKKIVYSKEVTHLIGLIQKDTEIKVDTETVKGILISTTMDSLIILAKLDEKMKQRIYDLNGSLMVHLKFTSKETGKDLLFTLHTKFLNINNQGLDQKDLYFISMQIKRKISNELIRIFGLYHEETFLKLVSKKKKVECLLLSNDRKKDCIAESIGNTEFTLFTEDCDPSIINQKAIAIVKILNTGEVIEIIGQISRKEDDIGGKCHLVLTYNIDDQSPRFGYSIHVLKSLINT
jgi:hypothetical protein